MEKQGMGQRRRIYRSGLLGILFLLAFLPALWAEEGEAATGTILDEVIPAEETPSPPELRLETSPASPVVNNPWTVSVLVNHPRSSEVNVKPPRFPSSLILERVRTEVRSIQGERWTRVEFLFTPQRAGTITLEPFEVTVFGRQAESDKITVRFREETSTVRRYEPRFRWASPVPSIPAGERGELFLELTNWDPSKNPPRGFLWGKAPRNAILEEGEAAVTGEGSFRYPVFLIPLEGTEAVLESFSFQSGGFNLDVPGIKAAILPAQTADDPVLAEQQNESPADEIYQNDNRDIPFPTAASATPAEAVFPLFRAEYRRITATVKTLWENNRRVQAMAEIRRNERDSLSGPFLAPLRREMEEALGLGFTGNERWQPLKISFVSWIILVLLILTVLSILFVFRPHERIRRRKSPVEKASEKNVTSGRRGGFKTIIVLVVAIGFTVILVEEGMGNFLIGRLNTSRNSAVLESTPAYKIPDIKGAVNIRFDEGQPVTVTDFHLDWCYAETADGRFGWVPRKAVIIY